ncbi:MAG: GDSL-type esterase/lipase family protein [Lachnospiraceae bacterium]|nr:GDSL-type esterase/lipase family protein [Lachnospiraceae bacterium]
MKNYKKVFFLTLLCVLFTFSPISGCLNAARSSAGLFLSVSAAEAADASGTSANVSDTSAGTAADLPNSTAVITALENTTAGMRITYAEVSGADSYVIYRSTSKNGKYTKVGTVTSGSADTFTDKSSSFKNGRTYYYKVTACSGSTSISSSAAVSLKYLSPQTVSSVKSTSAGYAKVSWKKNSKASGYYIYRKTEDGSFQLVGTVKKASTLSWTDKTVSCDVTYTYYVQAYSGSSVSAAKNTASILIPQKTSLTSLTPVSGGIRIKWSQVSNAAGYQIQLAQNKAFTSGKKTVNVKGASTVSTTVNGLGSSKKYFVRIRSYKTIGGKTFYSTWSSVKTTTTKRKVTVFAGDSIMTGLYASSYNGISKMGISGSLQVVAYTGINTQTFSTKAAFGSQSCLSKIISYNPTRVYIMLGMNEVEYVTPATLVANYKKIIQKIQKSCPNADIVVLSVSPVSQSVAARRKGFQQIDSVNSKLKTMAGQLGCRYYNFAAQFKNSSGYLKSEYSGGDGIHWNAKGYQKFAELITAYDAKLD